MKKKPITLDEAQKKYALQQFAKEHPSEGNKEKLEELLKKYEISIAYLINFC